RIGLSPRNRDFRHAPSALSNQPRRSDSSGVLVLRHGAPFGRLANVRQALQAFNERNSSDSDIRAQVYDAQHRKVGREIVVASGPAVQDQPAVAMDVRGNFVVVWTEEVDGNRDVLASRYSSTGARRGPVTQVAATPIGEFE